ncbi:MAG: hypothetical protein A3K04_00505 [Gallionellales bacterium RBG_16_56_9]|nr:MAG: hypothetical protein A3K04_00505 [Gallionellales bacterium RBG_16_56_9]
MQTVGDDKGINRPVFQLYSSLDRIRKLGSLATWQNDEFVTCRSWIGSVSGWLLHEIEWFESDLFNEEIPNIRGRYGKAGNFGH